MSKIINTAAIKKITLNESDTEKSVMQNIAIIIRTRTETVPLYREFAMSHGYVDKPMTVAAPEIIADLREAIEQYEPRVRVKSIRFGIHPDKPGTLMPEVEVDIIEQES